MQFRIRTRVAAAAAPGRIRRPSGSGREGIYHIARVVRRVRLIARGLRSRLDRAFGVTLFPASRAHVFGMRSFFAN